MVRPDHYCIWTRSFIGRKNHKHFFLFTMYGSLYTLVFTIASARTAVPLFRTPENDHILALIMTSIYTLFGLAFFLFTLIYVVTMLYEFSVDLTTFEQMRHMESRPQRSCIKNWEYLFGSVKRWYTWMLPVDPFNVKSDWDLVDDEYYEYYEYSSD